MGPGEDDGNGPVSGIEPCAPVSLDVETLYACDPDETQGPAPDDTLPPPPAAPTIPAPPPSGERLTSWCNRVARDVGIDDIE